MKLFGVVTVLYKFLPKLKLYYALVKNTEILQVAPVAWGCKQGRACTGPCQSSLVATVPRNPPARILATSLSPTVDIRERPRGKVGPLARARWPGSEGFGLESRRRKNF